MDVPSVEHSDSDSGESWTLLENNSVYADEAPEFIEQHVKHEAQHEKDEDTDGISIISDSDHDTPSPSPPDHIVFEKCHMEGNLPSKEDIPEYVSVNPHMPNISDTDQQPIASEDFLGDTHAKHKTYVHRRNKRLSTVLNIIVLGSVITAAGVAIGHMWGAKNDCTMQTTSSVNKILSNLYKLQEENAYLRNKLKEFAFLNNNPIQNQKINNKNNKCRRVFEESLSNHDPRKFTKCVDENYKNVDNMMEHLVKPKYEKEFVADIDKLKTVYLQNKSWLDDEISRRMKIEEELLKKYNNEVNSAKEPKTDSVGQKNTAALKYSDSKDPKEETLGNSPNFKITTSDHAHKKVTYADSLHTEHNHRIKRDVKNNTKNKNNDWLASEHNINNFDSIKQEVLNSAVPNQNQTPKSEGDDDRFITDFLESATEKPDNRNEQLVGDNWIEVKPKFRRNEERYEIDDKNWPKHAEDKHKGKKEKRYNKQGSWKNNSNDNKVLENVASEEDIIKDDRYIVNKLKQEKKKNGFTNTNKKQKRKIKHEKWNMKGEFGEKYDAVETPEDFVFNNPDKNYDSKIYDSVSFINSPDYADRRLSIDKENSDNSENLRGNMEKNENILHSAEQNNWFEKRAMFRTEARKKYYEQFVETSPNNSSWYFRRMRKREQCRAKGDNSTFRKFYKDKKSYKIKH